MISEAETDGATMQARLSMRRANHIAVVALLGVVLGVAPTATPADAAPTSVVLNLSLASPAIRADGRATADLSIHATTPGGAPLAGATVALKATWTTPVSPGSARLSSRSVLLDSTGRGSAVVTSTRSGTVRIGASIRSNAYAGAASTTLRALRRSTVVFVNGGGSSITCSVTGVCTDPTGMFNPIRSTLGAQGFLPTDMVDFGYAGGAIDPGTSRWVPNAAPCGSSGGSLKTAVGNLRTMLQKIAAANPNTDLSVVGLSLGGAVAFQLVGAPPALSKGSRLVNVITLDGVIGGIPTQLVQHLETVAATSCFSAAGTAPAAQELNTVWNTTAPNQGSAQADGATLLCAVVGVAGCVAQTNAQALAAAPAGLVVQTWGSSLDGVLAPALCGFGGLPNAITTQVVSGAGGGLHAEPTTTGGSCTIYSHISVVASRSDEIAATIGAQQS